MSLNHREVNAGRGHASNPTGMAGKDLRFVPTRDVEKYLNDAFAVAPKGATHIFQTARLVNLYHTLERIVEDAGYEPWPNLIKNLRLSCENDWPDAGEAPAHVIAAWIGHSVTVQNNAYAIVSDGHFEQFNSRRVDSDNNTDNKPPRIDANDDESMLPPNSSPHDKTLKTSKNTGFQRSDRYFMKKSVGPRVV
ncbi:MAG: hypothetical protein GY758_15010 [Fuerstiella sp.]|nr:hypothetical protein [Fuerstiella sp.]